VGGTCFRALPLQPLPTEARYGLGKPPLQGPAITPASGAAIAGQQPGTECESIVNGDKLGCHSARCMRAASWTCIIRSATARIRVEWSSRTRQLRSTSPSVVMSSGVSFSKVSSASKGRSMIRPRPFPMAVSLLIVLLVPSWAFY